MSETMQEAAVSVVMVGSRLRHLHASFWVGRRAAWVWPCGLAAALRSIVRLHERWFCCVQLHVCGHALLFVCETLGEHVDLFGHSIMDRLNLRYSMHMYVCFLLNR